MKTNTINGLLLTATFMSGFTATNSMAKSPNRDKHPNVIFVLTDDMGYNDLACTGNQVIHTPNIDRFYAESSHLTDFHVSPTSAPSRSALMSGRYANRAGVWHTVGGRSILFDGQTILPEFFERAGYVNGMFGKWHLGDNYPNRPEDRGFHEVVAHGGGGITQTPDFFGNDYFDDTYRHNGKYEKFNGYCTDVFFEQAMKFIDENHNRPFFCYVALNAPHDPHNVPVEYHNIYKGHKELLDKQHRFYGMITNIDDNFKKLRDKLKQLNIEDNTILIFMTDNGTDMGLRITNDGRIYGNTANMRGRKNSPYDGGHRVPFFIAYPNGGIGGGKDIDKLCAHIDFLPTLAELCGLDIKDYQTNLDGRSLCPYLINKGKKWGKRYLFVDSQRRQNLIKWNRTAVMTKEWRLVNENELYKIAEDPMQEKNLYNEYPEVVKELTAEYDKWWESLQKEGCNEKYAYIQAGGKENPMRIAGHDLHAEIAPFSQKSVLRGDHEMTGCLKLEILTKGKYRFEFCRFPKETGYTFSSYVPAVSGRKELSYGSPESVKIEFKSVTFSIAQYTLNKAVDMNSSSVAFELDLEAGKYDLDGFFTDVNGIKYPLYYTYVEKLD